MGQLGKGERSLQASGRTLVELHKETSTESRKRKNLMKGEMRVRTHEGLKNKESESKLGVACLRSSWVIAKHGSFEMLATKWPLASRALGTEAEPGYPGRNPPSLSFQ